MKKRKDSAEKAIRDIRRVTRRQYSAEEKIRIVLEGLRGESSIAELCRKEGINQNLYYRWSKEFLEAGKKRLAGDTARAASSDEVKGLRNEAAQLKEALVGIPRSTFYGWYERFREGGDGALEDTRPGGGKVWNRLPETIRQSILTLALERPELSARELAVLYTERQRYFVSESSVYRLLKSHDLMTSPAFVLMKAADRFQHPTTAPNQLWQTDFTYLKVIGWGWFYLSTVLDDYSRYILAWKLCDGMTARDVSDTLSLALESSGLETANVQHRPRLLSDNGPSYVSAELRDWLDDQGMGHTRGAPYHPMTQGKIERWHRSMKNQVLLENYYLPGDLKARIGEFVDYYNTERYHESLKNLTPEDVYTGRGQTVLNRRRRIKQKTLAERRRLYYQNKAA